MRQALPGIQHRHRHQHVSLVISIQYVSCLLVRTAAGACGDISVLEMIEFHWHSCTGRCH